MSTHFYDHLHDPDRLHTHLHVLDMTDDERNHLVLIIQSTLHHRIIDVILEKLPDTHKDAFLDHVATDDHDAVWRLLNEHVQTPEETIREVITILEDELAKDVDGIL